MSIKQLSKVCAAAILTALLWGTSTKALEGQAQTAAVSPVTKQWIADLKSSDPVKRTQAADQLGSLRVRPAVPDLVGVLSDKDPRVREASAFALGEIADQDAANHLSRLLAGDTDASVRASSAFALGMLEDTKSVSALLDSLDDSSAEVRSAALVALGLMRDQDDVEDIEEMLNDSSLDVRYDAVWALGQIGDPDSAERLRSTLVNVDLVQFTPVAREAFREAVQAALD
ncbi:MAG: HEAT repeat domain-containing protein, partial [Blastocatellia bacterium]